MSVESSKSLDGESTLIDDRLRGFNLVSTILGFIGFESVSWLFEAIIIKSI
jgi:hypothetical protein